MKKLAIFGAVILSTLSVYAYKNPQIRACHSVGGQFFVANSQFDQFGLCKIGLSIVGAVDILNRNAQIEYPASLYNYTRGIQVCTQFNRNTLTTLEGETLEVCLYSDSTIIDIETLASGKNSGRNPELNKVLGL